MWARGNALRSEAATEYHMCLVVQQEGGLTYSGGDLAGEDHHLRDECARGRVPLLHALQRDGRVCRARIGHAHHALVQRYCGCALPQPPCLPRLARLPRHSNHHPSRLNTLNVRGNILKMNLIEAMASDSGGSSAVRRSRSAHRQAQPPLSAPQSQE